MCLHCYEIEWRAKRAAETKEEREVRLRKKEKLIVVIVIKRDRGR